jgi:DNA-binding HxlR family transcriptional regulator
MALLDLLGRRWTLRIMWELGIESPHTFRELQSLCDDISSSVLSSRLRELGDAGLVTHAGDGYALTDQGTSLLDHLLPLDAWAKRWATNLRDS